MSAVASDGPVTIAYPFGVNGVTLRVLEAGAGTETVVFLHGLGARADRWRLNMPSLAAAGFRVFALDFPGHGFSEKSALIEHSVPAYARLVSYFLDEVGARGSATLVGTSLGAHVAATVALADPSTVRALVLVGPVGMRPLGEAARQAIAASVVDTSLEGIAMKLRKVLRRQELVTPEWVREEFAINNSPGAAEALAAVARYFADDVDNDVLDETALRKLTAAIPTLFLWGEADEIVPLTIADELEAITGISPGTIPSAGHAPYFENADAFNAALIAFLREPDRRKRLSPD